MKRQPVFVRFVIVGNILLIIRALDVSAHKYFEISSANGEFVRLVLKKWPQVHSSCYMYIIFKIGNNRSMAYTSEIVHDFRELTMELTRSKLIHINNETQN